MCNGGGIAYVEANENISTEFVHRGSNGNNDAARLANDSSLQILQLDTD